MWKETLKKIIICIEKLDDLDSYYHEMTKKFKRKKSLMIFGIRKGYTFQKWVNSKKR